MPKLHSSAKSMRKYEKKFKTVENVRALDQCVSEYVNESNQAICNMLLEKHSLNGGTTFAMIHFFENAVKLYYLGDSRIYAISNHEITQLTRDHTLANQKIDASIYTEEEARNSPDHHRLTLFIGADKNDVGLNADSRPLIPYQNGLKFLLCTDGLTAICTTTTQIN